MLLILRKDRTDNLLIALNAYEPAAAMSENGLAAMPILPAFLGAVGPPQDARLPPARFVGIASTHLRMVLSHAAADGSAG